MRPRPGLRRNALEKLATLSAQPTTGASYPPDLNRLCKQYNPPAAGANGTSTPNGVLPSATPEVPMSLRELEVLLALCKAAPLVRKLNIAESLLHQLTPYLPEAHTQDFPSSAFHQRFNPSPWEVLTHQLTSAVLSLGLNHPSLRSSASDTVQRTVLAFTQSAQSLVWSYSGEDDDADHLETEHSTKSIMLSVSLVGFLEAIAKYARFWSPSEAFDFMQELGSILSEKFMVAVEGALSSLRNTHGHQRSLKDWKAMLRHYAASSRPLGAMLLQQGFMHFVAASASLLVIDHHRGLDQGLLDVIIARNRITINRELDDPTLDGIADLAEKQMSLLDADSDYLQLSSAWQQRLAFTVKAYILETFLCCSLVDDDIADTDVLMGWLESLLMDPIQLADESLASVALKCMAVLSRSSSTIAASRCRFLSRFLVQSRTTSTTAAVAAQCLAVTLKSLPEDSTISTLYSLGNVLSAASGHDRALNASPFFDSGASTLNTRGPYSHPASGSAISLIASDEETIASMYGTIVRAIVTVACSCKDEKITALAISMLAQKLGRISPAVDAEIVTETASLSAYGGPSELKSLLKLYSTVVHQAIERHDDLTTNAAMKARVRLASSIHVDSPLYEVYAIHLCDAIVSKGDAHEGGHTREQDAKRAAEEIAQLLRPLAVLVTARAQRTVEFEDEKALHILGRDAWFNIVVHNFGFSSPLGQKYMKELQVLARHTRPLIDEDRADTLESDIETNTVLRRGMNAQHAVEQKAELTKSLPSCEADIRSLALGAVGQLNGNAASAFVAQLADRQRYRKTGTQGMSNGDLNGKIKNDEARDMMKGFEPHVLMHKEGLTGAITHTLRSATASLYCPSNRDCSLAQFVVGVPFTVFTKHSIKLGISLWSGIIQENPSMESRILLEIAMNWEKTVRNKQGLFNPALQHPDPFYIKEEFAPSNAEALTKRRQVIQDMLESHYQLVQFLSSRFHATRLLNGHVERTYHRMMHVTLKAMRHGTGHPLARELHFQLLSLALDVLRLATGSGSRSRWALKDQVLSSGLAWFRFAPSEISRLNVWLHPLDIISRGILHYNQHASPVDEAALLKLLPTAWLESPSLFVQLVTRFQSQSLVNDVRMEIICRPEKFVDEPDALTLLIGPSLPRDVNFQLKYLLYWAPVNPITAVTYFLPAYGNHPLIIQYAMRALESHSVDVTFFYVPQIVQTLRYDVLGYVERYIIETAKFSQLFAHQIIWNIKANAYKDEDSQVPDPMKPKLDDVTDALISSLSEDDKSFYEREFTFFNEVTSISGKLKPFIKRPKPEKKQKIEEELRKIQVDVGVYLPSNPDGVVIGIDRKSGKPLQSHAKAPFMATFRIRKELGDMEATEAQVEESAQNGEPSKSNTYEVWQSAIFKVGDDCRQDVLALQMIAAFRGIFNDVGLEVYVFPYRVTATAPGCGVIDVLPNSISRDMMGREAVNGLYSWFVSKFGSEDSIRFQEARINFVKSMAAYSVISYLLQFKDRHNGNIMLDDAGHILHIDFGFCFDIAPGGVRFERAPFKLTAEMVAVMGGSTTAQPYRWFEELCVKAFLASRQHAEKLCHIVLVMLDSGLPCFKPETIQHLRERFVLDKTEREAAEFMRMLVHRSERSYSTKGYDQFQLLTNGIPY
ncbi:hypothetical protein LTR28_002156 [Elasticomyces elasticus]|nr:hypothetical protein LTR28_002156 [Elasticomyces elasticus]